MRKRKIRKDDEVIVLTGRDKGKRGAVLRVVTKTDRVLVEGVNVTKRHVKPTQADPRGGIVEREAPIHISNVALIDPESDRPDPRSLQGARGRAQGACRGPARGK